MTCHSLGFLVCFSTLIHNFSRISCGSLATAHAVDVLSSSATGAVRRALSAIALVPERGCVCMHTLA